MKKIVFLLISAILCVSLGLTAAAALPDKVGYIDNTDGNDASDGLSDKTPKFYQGQVGGIGLRNLMYGGGTIVACGDFGINSDQAWDYGGPTVITGCYGGKDYRNAVTYTGVFKLGRGVTLTVANSLTFDKILFDAVDPVCRILVPNGASLTITDTVTMMQSSLIVEVEAGGKANIQGGKYLAIEGEGEITVGEKVQFVEETVAFVSNASGNNKNDGLSASTPKRDLGTENRPGLFHLIKSGGTLVASGDLLIPVGYDWQFGRKITVTGKYNGIDYRDADNNKGVVNLAAQATLTVRSDLVLDNVFLMPDKDGNTILVKNGATLEITDTVETIGDKIVIIVERGGVAKIEGGTYLAVQGNGEFTVGGKAKTQGKTTIFLSESYGSDQNSGLSVASPKTQMAQGSGVSGNTLIANGGTVVLCGERTIYTNEVWSCNGQLTVTGGHNGKNYKNAIANTGVLQIIDGKAMTLQCDLVLDNLILRPGKTISGIRVMSGATLTITDSVDVLDDTMVIIVEEGGTANIAVGTYKAIRGKGTVNLGEKVKTLDEEIACYISNSGGNNNNGGISDVSPKQTQGQKGGDGARGFLYDGGTLVASGQFNIEGNYGWDYGGAVTLTGSYGGKDFKNQNANTGIFKLAKNAILTLNTDLTMDDILFQTGERSVIRVPKDRTLTITESVQVLGSHLAIMVDAGGTARIETGAYKSIQGGGNIILGEKVKLPQEKVGYISNTNGNDSNDGLSDATPKYFQGQVGGNGLRNLMYGGGTIVACGDFGIGGDQLWDYGGPMVVTGNYNGKNYKDYDRNTGIFNLGANSTLTVTKELTFDDILFVSGENSVVLVPDGATVRFTEKVDFQTSTLNVVVEKGGTAILEGGIYTTVTGEGDIRVSESVKILGGAGVNIPAVPGIAYISNTTGKSRNDGLSAATPKQYFGTVSGTGAHNLLAAGGTLVISGDYGIKKSMDWNLGGAATITAKANGTDYRNAEKNCGVFSLSSRVILTVASDLTLENVILVPSDTYNIIRVKEGATLTIDETVDVRSDNLAIVVDKGGKAVVKGGTYIAIHGEGDITVADTARIQKKFGAIQPNAPAKGVVQGNVGYISNKGGDDRNDGRTDATPKRQQGQVGGIGIRNMMYHGGTIVVCGDMEVATPQAWSYAAEVTVTGSYGGKDYRDLEANSGIFKLFSGVTVSTDNDLIFDDIIFMVGEGSRLHVKNSAVLSFGNGVSVVGEKTGEAGVCILSVDAGSVAVIPEEIKNCFIFEGEGEVVIAKQQTSAQDDGNSDAPDGTVETPPTETESTEDVVFLSDAAGDNANDGLTAQAPKKSLGTAFCNGAIAALEKGGRLVLCGALPIGGDYVWEVEGATTITASYGGINYKSSTAGCLTLATDTIFTVCSDLTLENMRLVFEGAPSTVVVSGATFTVTDTVQFACGTGATPACKLILTDGATAVLSDAAKKIFTVVD